MRKRHGQRPWILAISLGLLLLAVPVTARSQETAPQTPTATNLVEDPPPPTAIERLDGFFARGVDWTSKVLFYRIGSSEWTYVLYEPHSIYVRDRGSEGPFTKLDATENDAQNLLTNDDVDLRAARGDLASGHRINGILRNYRWGLLNGKPVEYVILKREGDPQSEARFGSKFIRSEDGTEFFKLSGTQNLPGGDPVSLQTIESWNAQGYLVRRPDAAQSADAYLHTETRPHTGMPIVVAWLFAGAVFFTLYLQFFNIWGFKHAIECVRGKYDNPAETGEVSHFQALASALSGTVGLGNIAGVTIAMTLGGPGAFFWMLVSGVLGMSSKFAECTLAVKYRTINPDGTVLGGPMAYLKTGLAEMGLKPLGVVLSLMFTVLCLMGSFGGGNMLQANQAGSAMLQVFQQSKAEELRSLNSQIAAAAEASDTDVMRDLQTQRSALLDQMKDFSGWFKVTYGILLAAAVAVVIIGGIKRIGAAAEKIVPAMCLLYVGACLFIIFRHLNVVPEVIGQVFTEAFSGKAMGGGLVGVLVIGVQRAAFSNEAGAGSAAIAHSAAKTEEPIREGCVALLEPFIDTIVVCSMTALVILITGAWNNSEWILDEGLAGAALTARAFEREVSWFPILLSIAVTLFAYSTIISWSYYGERSWSTLFGSRTSFVYKILTVVFVFVGTVVNLGSVLDFSDMMILGMAFPNILGLILLAPKIKRDLTTYWAKYRSGQFPTYH